MTRYPVFAAGMTHPVNVCTLTGPQPEVEQKALVKSQAEAPGWLSLECQSLLYSTPRVLRTHREPGGYSSSPEARREGSRDGDHHDGCLAGG